MFNQLIALLHRPERGWDPVPLEWAEKYSAMQCVDQRLLDRLEEQIGGLAGKAVLDLGGGPGQFSVAFAQRGAVVTWYDVSRNYLSIAQRRAREAQVDFECVLGYMDEAPQQLRRQFDLVFNRGCFNYGWTDTSFAAVVYQLIRPGGYGYVDTNNLHFRWDTLSPSAKMRAWLNARASIKIGHPFPPRGRIARLFLEYPVTFLCVDYSDEGNDRVFFQKRG